MGMNKNQKKKKTFGQENWQYFEILTKVLFEKEFGFRREEIKITQMTRDDGRDIEVNYQRLISPLLGNIDIKVWVEAKLRESMKVELGDIAGNVIIASNWNIEYIYFVTNYFFSEQTVKELILFSDKSGLKIRLIDGYNYRLLLKKHKDGIIGFIEQDFYLSRENINEIENFVNILLENLPKKKTKLDWDLDIGIVKGHFVEKYKEGLKAEEKIEARIMDLNSIKNQKMILDLSLIKLNPYISENEIDTNVDYKLIGNKRRFLLNSIIEAIAGKNITFLKGDSGCGKSFLANYVTREFYKRNYHVCFIDVYNQNVLSFTKNLLANLVGMKYFQFLEHKYPVVKYLEECFNLDTPVAQKIVNLMQKDSFSEEIPGDICQEILINFVENYTKRKDLFIVFDNFQFVTTELLKFLKNILIRLKRIGIPALILTIEKFKPGMKIPENEWLEHLNSIIGIHDFHSFTMEPLEDQDIEEYISSLIPGANENIVNIVRKNTLDSPFFIKVYVEYIKSKKIIDSADKRFWWLEATEFMRGESEKIRSNRVDTLIQNTLKIKFQMPFIKKLATILFFFDNRIKEKILNQILDEKDIADLFRTSQIFSIENLSDLEIRFSHDLYYVNFIKVVGRNELILEANILLEQLNKGILDNIKEKEPVLGKIYHYGGDFQKAKYYYNEAARYFKKIDRFRAMLYAEKTLEMIFKINSTETYRYLNWKSYSDVLFGLLEFYDYFNYLKTRKSPEIFIVLERHKNLNLLSNYEQIYFYYFLGRRETKEENFLEANKFFTSAYNILSANPKVSQKLASKVISNLGINLKHIGEKQKSIFFFKKECRVRKSQKINYERYANVAAYYLTSNRPDISLRCFKYMHEKLGGHSQVHLTVDFGMAYFYLNRFEDASRYLNEALEKARKESNLAEEARAENIQGLIEWKRGKIRSAEHHLDLSLLSSELSNNKRWLWRIRSNLAQIAYEINKIDKSYNLCWAVINHTEKTKIPLIQEVRHPNIISRRFAALKAVINILYKMNKVEDINKVSAVFVFQELEEFIQNLRKYKNVEFDKGDSNLLGDRYYILG
jgi:tetratricopeptide (TPR) repeat protein